MIAGDVALFSASCSACLLDQLVPFTQATTLTETIDWIVSPDRISPRESIILTGTPEHFVDDVSEMLLFIAKSVSFSITFDSNVSP